VLIDPLRQPVPVRQSLFRNLAADSRGNLAGTATSSDFPWPRARIFSLKVAACPDRAEMTASASCCAERISSSLRSMSAVAAGSSASGASWLRSAYELGRLEFLLLEL